jgi:hypothetical protein
MGFYPVPGQPVPSLLPHATQEAILPSLPAVREANAASRAVIVVWDHVSSPQSGLLQREARKMNIYRVPLPP